MNAKNRHRKEIREHLKKFTPSQEAKLSKNLWRINYATMKAFYPNLCASVPQETLMHFMEDVVYADRIWRHMRLGADTEVKEVLEQEYQLNELGAEPNYHNNVKQLEANNKV